MLIFTELFEFEIDPCIDTAGSQDFPREILHKVHFDAFEFGHRGRKSRDTVSLKIIRFLYVVLIWANSLVSSHLYLKNQLKGGKGTLILSRLILSIVF